MNKKHWVFVFRSSPYGSSRTQEGVDALLAAAVFDQPVSVIFLGDGVYQLCSAQAPGHGRNVHKMLQSFSLYDIEQVFYQQSALHTRGISANAITIPAQPLDNAAVAQHLASATHILSF